MGTYLSTPITEKCEESGESLDCPDVPCAWGVVDMQGWRKSMEDSHIAVTDITLPSKQQQNKGDDEKESPQSSSDAKVFGVFDGHGGPEVARFCQLYLVSVLQKQSEWRNDGEKEEGRIPTSPDDARLPNPDDPEACAATPMGKALRSTFHALDRMIEDPTRRQEIMQLRNTKPLVGERKDATGIPPIQDISHITPPEFYTQQSYNNSSSTAIVVVPADSNNSDDDDQDDKGNPKTANDDGTEPTKTDTATDEAASTVEAQAANAKEASKVDNKSENSDTASDDENAKDDDSDEAVGKGEAMEMDRDMMMDGDHDSETPKQDDDMPSDVEGGNANAAKVTTMFQKIMSLGGGAGQVALNVGGSSDGTEAGQSDVAGPNARKPTMFHQGRMICNLPDHPIHAGATAIVAVVTGRILTVANAGDSRAVLCRAGGATFPLSFDHKPSQDREMTRITQAGGFVNHFGRINGNLNLSRSIGDLKYKQVPGIPPADQMITAEPDIMQVSLLPDDEFIILGCDGIWDCLSNEAAVEYVRKRIDSKTPIEIGREMLDEIVSVDPRETQGIGGDNMTIMIIDLQPKRRSWRKNSGGAAQITDADETEQ